MTIEYSGGLRPHKNLRARSMIGYWAGRLVGWWAERNKQRRQQPAASRRVSFLATAACARLRVDLVLPAEAELT